MIVREDARAQRKAAAEILRLRGDVWYDYEIMESYPGSPGMWMEPPEPEFLQDLLGRDFLHSIVGVTFYTMNLATGETPCITDADLVHLDPLDDLRVLHLHNQDITDGGLPHVGRLTELEDLALAWTDVSDAGLDHLRGLTKLRRLDLRGTNVTADGVSKLQKALPHTEMLH